MQNKTVVIFRKWRKERDVIALFPCVAANSNLDQCESYQHIGQHGAASIGLMNETIPALASESASLRRELESAPYNYSLDIRVRVPTNARQLRRAQIAKYRAGGSNA